jgi:hypothetical protein
VNNVKNAALESGFVHAGGKREERRRGRGSERETGSEKGVDFRPNVTHAALPFIASCRMQGLFGALDVWKC